MYIFCVIIYVIIFRLLSFDVIIFHGQQMISFLCYQFLLYIFCVIIYVIIWCYHLLLSLPPFFLFPENVTHSCILCPCCSWTIYSELSYIDTAYLSVQTVHRYKPGSAFCPIAVGGGGGGQRKPALRRWVGPGGPPKFTSARQTFFECDGTN